MISGRDMSCMHTYLGNDLGVELQVAFVLLDGNTLALAIH